MLWFLTRFTPNYIQTTRPIGFMKFGKNFGEKGKIRKMLRFLDQKWAFFTKNWVFSKKLILNRLFNQWTYDAEIWSGCSPKVYGKTGVIFLRKRVSSPRYTLFYTKKSRFLQKIQFLRIKKCVAPQRHTFLGKNNSSFFVPLRATSWPNFTYIGPVVEKPIQNQFFWENSIFSKKWPFLVENPQHFPNFSFFTKNFTKFHKSYWPCGLDIIWGESG